MNAGEERPDSIRAGVFHPLTHQCVQLFLFFCGGLLVFVGFLLLILAIITIMEWSVVLPGQLSSGRGVLPGIALLVGALVVLFGFMQLTGRIPVWMKHRWPARCPACGKAMDFRTVRWDPDTPFVDDYNQYREYGCRACDFRYNNSWMKWMEQAPPVKQPWPLPPVVREPCSWADGIKTVIALLVIVGIIAFLYWAGLVGNPECDPHCF